MFTDAALIFSYTRAQAIEDGVLVDVSAQAKEAGFRIPVAVAAAVWAKCVEWPESEPAIQNESGRLWDLVFMAAVAARATARHDKQGGIAVELLVVPRGGEVPVRTPAGPARRDGRSSEPVATIMEPGED